MNLYDDVEIGDIVEQNGERYIKISETEFALMLFEPLDEALQPLH